MKRIVVMIALALSWVPDAHAQAATSKPVRVRIATSLVTTTSTPNGEIGAAVDASGALHLVHAQSTGDVEDLYYTKVVGSVASAPVKITNLGLRRVRHPHVAVSGDVVHVAFFVARKPDTTKVGNFAVFHARGGPGGFSTEQVSDNPVDPSLATVTTFSCHVNDRPKVFFDAAGKPVVEYMSASVDGFQGHGNYVVFATRGATGWSREQAFRPLPNHSVEEGIAVPTRWQSPRQVAYYDIDKYQPHLVTFSDGRWNDQTIAGPGGYASLDDVALDYDAKGIGHLTWVAKKEPAFFHRTVQGAVLGPLEKIALSRSPWSNFAPTALDPVTNKLSFLFEDILRGDDRQVVLTPTAAGAFREVAVPTLGDLPGVLSGHGSFHMRDGRAWVVTSSTKAGQIFVTQFTP